MNKLRGCALLGMVLFGPALLQGQESVCDLFKNLKAADGQRRDVPGDLIISKDVGVLLLAAALTR